MSVDYHQHLAFGTPVTIKDTEELARLKEAFGTEYADDDCEYEPGYEPDNNVIDYGLGRPFAKNYPGLTTLTHSDSVGGGYEPTLVICAKSSVTNLNPAYLDSKSVISLPDLEVDHEELEELNALAIQYDLLDPRWVVVSSCS